MNKDIDEDRKLFLEKIATFIGGIGDLLLDIIYVWTEDFFSTSLYVWAWFFLFFLPFC